MHLFPTTTIAPIQRLIATLLLSALASCGGGSSDDSTQALTESDFAANPSLRLNYGAVGVTFMEAKGGTASAGTGALPDTGDAGMDVMPLHIAQQTSTTYSLDPKDDTLEKVQLVRLPGKQLVFEITASNPSAKVTLEPGDYDLLLYSGHKDAQPRTVFLHSSPTEGLLQSDGSATRGGTQTPTNQTISKYECRFCDMRELELRGVDLYGADLYGANLSGADLSEATLISANLGNANLARANVLHVSLVKANLRNADLTRANLTRSALNDAVLISAVLASADLTRTVLTRANLTSSDLTAANLPFADLGGANLTLANLSRANLTSASLIYATLTGADTTGAIVTGADFTGAIGYPR
jgi:uncharacterized protein YjbI with pentapeptide repeats